ncbi:hypothetical protein GJ496_006005 [Pomphorhynchus laevis]|nr:hypothetical protein GJ496_006005 [Pomphorhynchus laevis]
MFFGYKPCIDKLKNFGCEAFALIPQHRRTKFQKMADSVIFIGYINNAHAYKLLDPLTKFIYLRADIRFDENSFSGLSSRSSTQYNIQNQTYDLSKNAKTILETECTDSTESPQKLDANINQQDYEPADDIVGEDDTHFYDDHSDHEINNEWYDVHNEPSSIHEALNCNDRNEWKKAIDSEIGALKENNTWELVDRPEEKYKARLVAKGCAQIYGVDYFETYSPVVKLTTIGILIAVAVERNMLLHQMDISNAFLNGKLEENIFMEQPEGFIINPNKVCKLDRSNYGLRQSPRCWNNTLTEYLKNNGFAERRTPSGSFTSAIKFAPHQYLATDSCPPPPKRVFTRDVIRCKNDTDKSDVSKSCKCSGRSPRQPDADVEFMIIAVYVDDLIIASKNQDDLVHMKTELGMRFKAKDYNELNYCLGIEINIHEDNIELQQTNFIQRMLNKYQMAECKIVTICTRPDIAYAVGILSRFNISPNDLHLTAAKQVMRYLRRTKDFRLRFVYTGKLTLQGYCDADLANNADDRTSTSGNIFILANVPVSWISCKQRIVALLSTAEAEYVALSVATQEVQWLRQVLADIGEQCNEPTTIFEDNQPAIAIASGKSEHKRTKHIDIKFHFVRASIQQRIVKLEYCTTNEMLADIMTKPLNKEKIQYFRNEFGHKSSIMEEYQTRGNVVKEAFGIHYTLSDFHWASFAM